MAPNITMSYMCTDSAQTYFWHPDYLGQHLPKARHLGQNNKYMSFVMNTMIMKQIHHLRKVHEGKKSIYLPLR